MWLVFFFQSKEEYFFYRKKHSSFLKAVSECLQYEKLVGYDGDKNSCESPKKYLTSFMT